ncbi:MAG: hypothetical protein AABY15_07090 [Nanoarchaeota archaeon]
MELELTEESVIAYLQKNYNEDALISEVDEAKSDFLDDGWEEEFDDEFEAYAETGRGEAESQVRAQIESDVLGKLNIEYFEFEKRVGKTISEIITDIFPVLDAE